MAAAKPEKWKCPNCGAAYCADMLECEAATCRPAHRFADSGPGPGPLRDRLMAAEHAARSRTPA